MHQRNHRAGNLFPIGVRRDFRSTTRRTRSRSNCGAERQHHDARGDRSRRDQEHLPSAVRLRIKQAGEEHRFRRRLSPSDCLAGTDQLRKIERFGRYGDRGFHAPLRAAISEEVETRRASSGTLPLRRELSIMPEENMPPHFANHSSASKHPGQVTIPRYAPLPVRGSVHLSRQFLEKLTESAVIKVALREDLTKWQPARGGLRLHPAVAEGCRR
jgi:hypothetical protein